MLYYRGISEYKTGKTADAEKSFNAVVKLNPKDSLSLFYLANRARQERYRRCDRIA